MQSYDCKILLENEKMTAFTQLCYYQTFKIENHLVYIFTEAHNNEKN